MVSTNMPKHVHVAVVENGKKTDFQVLFLKGAKKLGLWVVTLDIFQENHVRKTSSGRISATAVRRMTDIHGEPRTYDTSASASDGYILNCKS
jgi:hypothetical protein